ncbi:hypothetical protein ABBQ38_005586 [Trebouxia sp. C0009 RCD-2024]
MLSEDAAITGDLGPPDQGQEETQQQDQGQVAQPPSDAAASIPTQLPDPEQPEVGVPGIPDKQPLPEEILAAGLIPPDQGIVSAEATEESAAAADATSTLEEDVQTDTSQQAGASQVAGAEEPALTDTLASAELSPSSTAALIQARVPTPAREAQEATASSRPTSTEIASQIEGFEDDFKAPEADVLSLGAVPEEAGGEDEGDVEELEEVIEAAKQNKRMLADRNASLQNKVHQYLEARNKGRVVAAPARDSRQGLDVAYLSALTTCAKLAEEENRIQNHFASQTMSLKATLEEKLKKSEELRATFHHFLTEIAKSAENSKTGRPLPHKVLSDYTKQEAARDAELQKVRLRHLMLKAQLAKIEHRVKQKTRPPDPNPATPCPVPSPWQAPDLVLVQEELAEGLHLIDFEQLKIENQSLNEKIEERNEDLVKLRKKTATTVQILTHVKEKLQFAQKEKQTMQVELDSVEAALATHRDDLGRVKLTRDKALAAARKLKDSVSHVSSASLLADLEACKDKRGTLQESMDQMKLSYNQTTAQTIELTQQVLHMTSHVRSQVEASDMVSQQGGFESLGADNINGQMLNSRADTASPASRPRTMHPALSRSKAVSRGRSQMSNASHVEYIPALKLG